jgi:hypothetical protein
MVAQDLTQGALDNLCNPCQLPDNNCLIKSVAPIGNRLYRRMEFGIRRSAEAKHLIGQKGKRPYIQGVIL